MAHRWKEKLVTFGFYDVNWHALRFAQLESRNLCRLVHEKTITGLPLTYILTFSVIRDLTLPHYQHTSIIQSNLT